MSSATTFRLGILARTRISTLLRVIITSLAGPLIGICVFVGLEALTARNEATIALQNNEISDLLLDAAGHWALERGLTNAALNAPSVASPANIETINERRKLADAAETTALERIRVAHRFPNKDLLIQRLEAAHTTFSAMREKAVTELSKDRPQRNDVVLTQWAPTASHLIEASRELRVAMSTLDTDALRRMAMLTELKDFAWVISEYAGRERAVIAARLSAGSRLTPDDLVELSQYRGRLELAWGKIAAARDQDQLPPEVTEAIGSVEQEFFGTFQPMRLRVYDESGTAVLPSPAEWVATSTSAINTILGLNKKIGQHTAKVADETRTQKTFYLAVMAAVLVGAVVTVSFAFRIGGQRIIHPISAITVQMGRLANGDLDAVFVTPYQDEISEMAKAVDVFRQNAIERQRLEEQEKADLIRKAERQKRIDTATSRFDATIISMMQKIRTTTEHLHVSADTLSANAEQTQRQSAAVAAATEEATSSVETVSAAGTELIASIGEISRQVQESAKTTQVAASDASSTNQKIGALAEAAKKIGQIVNLINSIAGQTNLLALNATIESARAGDAGKGFAVVAHEVKNLAGQTSRATEEIAGQITSVQQETESAVQAIEEIAQTIYRINEMSTVIAGAVEEQGAATAEIARNVELASHGTREVANNISGVAAAAAETGRMAQDLFGAANTLLAESQMLEAEVQQFLQDVRAA